MALRMWFWPVLAVSLFSGVVSAQQASTDVDERAAVRAMVERAEQRQQAQEVRLLQMEKEHEALKACLAKGMYYAPGTAGANAQGCVEIVI